MYYILYGNGNYTEMNNFDEAVRYLKEDNRYSNYGGARIIDGEVVYSIREEVVERPGDFPK